MDTDEDTLVVLVTKDPLFWLKSMSKNFYEMQVAGHSRHDTGLGPLFGELRHEGRLYGDALELWAATAGASLDERLYPTNRCVLLRYEDFLFRFWDVMVHLSAFLPANVQRLKESPSSSRSKVHGGREVRGREEALRFYSSCKNRHSDFAPEHLERMRSLSPALLRALGYEPARDLRDVGGLCSWVPELRPGDIVAAYFRLALGLPSKGGEDGEVCSPAPTWALVVERREEDTEGVALELLSEVPRKWIQKDPRDWSVVEWPARSWSGSPLDLANGLRQTVPRSWVDLRIPCPRSSVADMPLTEEGYRAVVSLRSTGEMASFITRVVADLEVHGARNGRILDRRRLFGFARWFSGEAMVQSLAQIRQELPLKEANEGWVAFAPPKPTRGLPAPASCVGKAEADVDRVA